MEVILEFLRSDTFLLILVGIVLILFIIYFFTLAKLSRLRKDYASFMKKMGNGENLDEMLKGYISQVENVKKINEEIIDYCKKLDNNIANCTQKIGMVRYNAYKDTGSDLSFTLAMLDDHNNGVVLNGIYARDMSNIYAKPVENGISSYTLSDEEKEAIQKAINKNN